MSFSEFLSSRRADAKALVAALKKQYDYVSVLGADIQNKTIRVDRNTSGISAGRDTECGFVVKMSRGRTFFEYSLDDISGDIEALAAKIIAAFDLNKSLLGNAIDEVRLSDEPLKESFVREHDFAKYTENELLAFCKTLCSDLLSKSEYLLNAVVSIDKREVSKLFVSENRELDQNFTWVNGGMVAVYKENGKVVQTREGSNSFLIGDILAEMPTLTDVLLEKAHGPDK